MLEVRRRERPTSIQPFFVGIVFFSNLCVRGKSVAVRSVLQTMIKLPLSLCCFHLRFFIAVYDEDRKSNPTVKASKHAKVLQLRSAVRNRTVLAVN